ncbi:MAG: hypothetical protein GYA34_06140 [Chloroflexi bacterium]|nr:hypothetical protein [Chloroflexota bacterium]
MRDSKRLTKLILTGALIAVTALSVAALSLTSSVKAASQRNQNQATDVPAERGGFRGNPENGQKYLAEALGITEDELKAAQEEANKAVIQAAVDQGLITQEQADEMLNSEKGFPRFGFGGPGRPGEAQDENKIDYHAYLAETLGISEDELKAAQETARKAMLADAVANGDITQEQVDLMEIRQALSSYLDPRALQVKALGITEDELKAYLDERKSMEDILSAVGMTTEEYQEALQAAYKEAVAQAVTDGAVTQEQADLFLENFEQGMPGMGGPGHGQKPPAQNGSDDQKPSGTPPAPGQGGGPRMGGPGGGPGGSGGPGGFGNPGWFGGPDGNANPRPTATPSSISGTNS